MIPNSVTTIGTYAFYDTSINTIYYKGTAKDWNKDFDYININNSHIIANATHYNYSYDEPELNDDGTDYNGNYWRYVNNEICVWKTDAMNKSSYV